MSKFIWPPLSPKFHVHFSPPSSTKQNSCPKINGPQKPTDHKASSRLTPSTTLVHTHPSPGNANQHFAFWPHVNASLEKTTWFALQRNFTNTLALQTQKAHAHSTTWQRQLERSIPTENNTLVFFTAFLDYGQNCGAMTTKMMMPNACCGSENVIF